MRTRLKNMDIYAALVLVLYFATSLAVAFYVILDPSFADETALQTILIYAVSFGLPSLLYGFSMKRRFAQPFRDTFSFHKIPVSTFFISLALGLLIQPFMSLIGAAASLVFPDIVSGAITDMTAMPLWMFTLTLAILPAFFEELVCRGLLEDGCRETPFWFRLVIPAAFFALLHLNFQQVSYAFAAGLFLCLVFLVTGSLWPSMIIHFIVNFCQSFVSYLAAKKVVIGSIDFASLAEDTQVTPQSLAQLGIICACCLPVVILLLYLLMKKHQFKQKRAEMKASVRRGWGADAIALYVMLGVLLALTFLVQAASSLLPLIEAQP